MPQSQPFDQDEPSRRSRPTDRATRRRGAPTGVRRPDPGSGGRARQQGSGGDGSRPSRPSRSGGDGPNGSSTGLPRWAIPAAVGGVVLLVLLLVVKSCSGGSSRDDAGSCLTDLAANLPASATAAFGTDFVQASRAGWTVDGSLEEIGTALGETGVIPDPVTVEYRINRLATPEQFEARTGMSPGDVECALDDGARAVLTGSFDPPAVNGSQGGADGDLAATEDILAMDAGRGDPKALLETAEDDGLAGNEAFVATLEQLREAGAYSVIVQRGDGEDGRALAAGVGAGGEGDERIVLLAWAFDGDDDAKAGRPEIVNRVNAVLKGTLSITAADLEVDGSLVTATIPAQSAPDLQDLRLRGVRLVDDPE